MSQFLSLFWTPFVWLLETKECPSQKKVKINQYRTLAELVKINTETTYGLHFTPNGNLGRWLNAGDYVQWMRVEIRAEEPPHCFFVEIDVKTHSLWTKEEVFKHIMSVSTKHNCTPSLIVETPWWYHLYWLLSDEAKTVATFSGIDMITSLLIDLYEADKNNAFSKSKYMRVPRSYHWKTWSPILTTVHQVINGVWKEDFQPDVVKKISKKAYQNAVKYAEEARRVSRIIEKNTKKFASDVLGGLKWINMADLINNHLNKIPLKYQWNEYTFYVDAYGNISVNNKKTDWYKMNKKANYINCFTDIFHPIEERPRWNIMSFLYYYFDKDFVRVNHFLKDHYGISLLSKQENEMEREIERIDMLDYSVIFTNKRVSINKIVVNSSGDSAQHNEIVIRKEVKILGKAKITMWERYLTSDVTKDVYVVETEWNKRHFIFRLNTVKEFNKKHDGAFFWYGTDKDLGLFFEALDNGNYKEYRVVENNGYYYSNLYLGWVPFKDEDPDILNNIYTGDKDMIDFGIWRQKSIREYYQLMCKVFKPDVSLPALLWAIACSGMNIRPKNDIYPAVFISAKTWTWKSTLLNALRSCLWYKWSSRLYNYGMLTPQPTKEQATDNSIFWLEEVTGRSNPWVEQVLRGIINREAWARWALWWTLYYNTCSPLFCVWERMAWWESINNRFIMVNLGMKDRAEGTTLEDIDNLTKYSITDEVYKKYIDILDKWEEWQEILKRLYFEGVEKLKKLDIDARACAVWGYLFAVNDLFGKLVNDEELSNIVLKMIDRSWLWRKKDTPVDKQLYFFLTEHFASRDPKIVAFYDYDDWAFATYNFQIVNKEFFEHSRWTINMMLMDLVDAWVICYPTEMGFVIKINVADVFKKNFESITQASFNLYHYLENVKAIGKQYITVSGWDTFKKHF